MTGLSRRTFLAGLGSAAVVTACAPATTGTKVQEGVLNFGMLATLSGAQGLTASGQKIEGEVIADEINKAGGVTIGSTKYTFKWTILDDRSDAQVAVAAGIQLARDEKVKVVFGPLGTPGASVAPIMAQFGVIHLNSSATVTPLLEQPDKYPLLFGSLPHVDQRARLAVAALKKLAPPSLKRVAWMAPNDVLAQQLRPGLTTAAKANNLEWMDFLYPPGSPDLSTVATRVKAAQAEAVFSQVPDQEVINVLKHLTAAGVPNSVHLESFAGSAPTNILPNSGGRAIILFYNFPTLDPNDPNIAPSAKKWLQLQAAQIEKTGAKLAPSQFAAFPAYYNLVPLVLKAMQQAGTTTDNLAIAKAMKQVTADGVSGPVSFKGTNQVVFNMSAQYYPNGSPDKRSSIVLEP